MTLKLVVFSLIWGGLLFAKGGGHVSHISSVGRTGKGSHVTHTSNRVKAPKVSKTRVPRIKHAVITTRIY